MSTRVPSSPGQQYDPKWMYWFWDWIKANRAGGITAGHILTGDVLSTLGTSTSTTALSTTGVGTGTWGGATVVPRFNVDAKGRILVATNAGTLGTFATFSSLVGTGDLLGTTTTSTFTGALSTTGVAAGTYGKSDFSARITIDAKGRITAATEVAITGGTGTGVASADINVTAPIRFSVGTGTGAVLQPFTLALTTTGVGTGTYGAPAGIPRFDVDNYGMLKVSTAVGTLNSLDVGTLQGGRGTFGTAAAALLQVSGTGTFASVQAADLGTFARFNSFVSTRHVLGTTTTGTLTAALSSSITQNATDPAGTSYAEFQRLTITGTVGTNTAADYRGFLQAVTVAGTGNLANLYGYNPQVILTLTTATSQNLTGVDSFVSVAGTGGGVTGASGFRSGIAISGTNTVNQFNAFLAVAPSVGTAAGTLGVAAGLRINNQGGTNVGNAIGLQVVDFSGASNAYGLQLLLSTGAGKFNIRVEGAAPNVFAGQSRFGGTGVPTEVVTVSGGGTFSGTLAAPLGIFSTGTHGLLLATGGTISSLAVGTGDPSNLTPLSVFGVGRFRRNDTSAEGGQINLDRALDGINSWLVDVQGTGTGPSFRIIDNNPAAATIPFQISSPGNKWSGAQGGFGLGTGLAGFTYDGTGFVIIRSPDGANGPNLQLIGTGTVPNKSIRVGGDGRLQVINHAYDTILFHITNEGNVGITGPRLDANYASFLSGTGDGIGVDIRGRSTDNSANLRLIDNAASLVLGRIQGGTDSNFGLTFFAGTSQVFRLATTGWGASGDALGTSTTGTLGLTLSTTGVTAGTYGDATVIPRFDIDAKGRVLSGTNAGTLGTFATFNSLVATGVFTGTTTTGTLTVAENFQIGDSGVRALVPVVATVMTTPTSIGGVGVQDMMSYSLPANALSAGRALRFAAWGTLASTQASKLAGLVFGTTTMISGTLNFGTGAGTAAGRWQIEGCVASVGASSQTFYSRFGAHAPLANGTNQQLTAGTSAMAQSGAITIKGIGTGSGSGEVTQLALVVEFLN